MYCKYCGKKINDDSLFCQYCGGEQDVSFEKDNKQNSTGIINYWKVFINVGPMGKIK